MKELSHYEKTGEFGKAYYEDDNGVYYEDLTSFLQVHILGFCGCGVPKQILRFIYDLLLFKDNWSDNNIDYEKYNSIMNDYFIANLEVIKWFVDYFLDNKNLTQHGGNVSGSWVDDRNFMDALKIWSCIDD